MKHSLKMSERHSASPGAGSEAGSPIKFKYSSLRDFCSTSSVEDSGHHELPRSCSFDNTDKDFFGMKEKDPVLIHIPPEISDLGLIHSLKSPAQRNKFVFSKKENTPELCETPKFAGKKSLPRRRLDVCFSLLKKDFELQNSSQSGISQVNLEKSIPNSVLDFPKQNSFSPLVTSNVQTEEVTSSSQTLRLNFSQHKTSTIDDSKDECSLFEVECISPIQGNNFKDSVTQDFSDSSLSVSDENTYPELLGSSGSRITYSRDEDIFVTPVSNLTPNIEFSTSQKLSPSVEVRGSISTPEDSGFNSLSLDKSDDSFSDQEGSFHELFQTYKGTCNVGDTIRKSGCLRRSRRLSTLQEQSSQSETEEEKQIIHPTFQTRPEAASDISESQLSTDKSRDLTLSFKNLSKTPALQLVHELCMKSKRKRFQGKDTDELLEERDGGKIAVLQCALAGLIGKKMGIEQLDILSELKYRNLKHILTMVLDSLTEESLYSVWNVSRNWREIIVQDKKANRRRKFYITHLKADSQVIAVHGLLMDGYPEGTHLCATLAPRAVRCGLWLCEGSRLLAPRLSTGFGQGPGCSGSAPLAPRLPRLRPSPWGQPAALLALSRLHGDAGAAGHEDSLATDGFLVDYFNEFLSLPLRILVLLCTLFCCPKPPAYCDHTYSSHAQCSLGDT
ncbi:F-box only protein 43 [Octodon degus]|uniref:F-box only protein 43 n=1 Tax=Octodon degus TaxID=10160 RepID=A0A6P3VCZ3_OCTDE|nr:F-box only protein 43 [Octodon degus]